MPFVSMKPKIVLSKEEMVLLDQVLKSRTGTSAGFFRARIIQESVLGKNVSEISRILDTNRLRVRKTIDKALQFGLRTALKDLPRAGRKPVITDEAQKWVISVACQKPVDLGYSLELWTYDYLQDHIRKNCIYFGCPELKTISRSTIFEILNKSEIKPHKIKYYLERR
ncbi:MAG: helix-turn-helix domain containing protein, partial [Candidatus Riflebacteria bacterium]|nr:helix-turn-helix domain containing protein [Candidatus Riflebacteria bacterium]